MSSADIPTPDNLCDRWELTTPTMAGFSDNAGSTTRERHIGIAEVECDIEANGRVQGGRRRPTLRRIARLSGRLGRAKYVARRGRDLVSRRCPSPKGETGMAFV